MKSTLICKIASASLALFISASPFTRAMDITTKPEKITHSQGQLRDHDYYKGKLQELEKSTTRIHLEVDRILKEFRRNMEEYYNRTRGGIAATGKSTLPNTENLRSSEQGDLSVSQNKKDRTKSQPAEMEQIEGKQKSGGLSASRKRSASLSSRPEESQPLSPVILAKAQERVRFEDQVNDIMGVLTVTGKICWQGSKEKNNLEQEVRKVLNTIISNVMLGDEVNMAQYTQQHNKFKEKIKGCQNKTEGRYFWVMFTMEDFVKNIKIPKPAKNVHTIESVTEINVALDQRKREESQAKQDKQLTDKANSIMKQYGITTQLLSIANAEVKQEEIRMRLKAMLQPYLNDKGDILPSIQALLEGAFEAWKNAVKGAQKKDQVLDALETTMRTLEDKITKIQEKKAKEELAHTTEEMANQIKMAFELLKFAAFVQYPLKSVTGIEAKGWLNFNKNPEENKERESQFNDLITSNKTGFVWIKSGVIKDMDRWQMTLQQNSTGEFEGGNLVMVKARGLPDQNQYQINIKTFALGTPPQNSARYGLIKKVQYYRIDIHDFKHNTEKFLTELKDKVDNQGYELWSIPITASWTSFLAIPPKGSDDAVICLDAKDAFALPGFVYQSIQAIREKFMK